MEDDNQNMEIRQRIEEIQRQLSSGGQLLRSLIDTSPVGIMMVDRAGMILFANQAFKHHRSEELIGRSVYEFLPADFQETVKNQLEALFKTGKSTQYTVKVQPKDKWEWYESHLGSVWQDDQIVAANITTFEITEKKKVDTALNESNRILELVTQNMTDLVSMCDSDFLFTYVSPTYKSVLGFEPEELLGQPIYELVHESELTGIVNILQQGKDDKVARGSAIHRLRHKNGSYLWFETKGTALYDDDGNPMGAEFNLREITDRKVAEDLLKESEERYQAFYNSHNLVFVTDTEGNFIDANQAALDLMGYDLEEIPGLRTVDIIHPGQAVEPMLQANKELIETGSQQEKMELKLQTKNQETKILEIKNVLIKDRGLVLGVANDITALKQTQEALKRSEQRLNDIFNSMKEGYYRTDMEGSIIWTNPAALEISGFDHQDDIVGKNIAKYFFKNPSDQDPFNKQLLSEGTASIEVEVRRKDGRIVVISANSHLIYDNDGKPVYVDGIFWDITERKKAEAEIEKTRNYLESIINSSPSMVICYDNDIKITQWNKTAEEKVGFTKSEVLDKSLLKFLPQFQKFINDIERALSSRAPIKREKVQLELNEGVGFFDLIFYPLLDHGVQGVVVTIDNVSERVRMEEMLIQTEKMMSLGGLSAGMAHEINNPLAGILQTAQNMDRRLKPDPEKNAKVYQTNRELAAKCGVDPDKVREYLELRGIFTALDGISAAGDRAAKIIKNMLDFGRQNTSKIQYESLHEMLDNSIDLAGQDYDLKKQFDFKNIEIVKEYDKRIRQVPCSKSELEQVMLNLLKNSAEAMKELPEGSPKPQIIIKTLRRGTFVQIQITDNGSGMDRATLKRIFDPFYTTKEVGQGTGLGLSVSYFIIKNHHGGDIFVESLPGKGATFNIHLPLST